MDRRLTGINPLAYLGVEPTTPNNLVINRRDPTVNDGINNTIGTLWITLPQRDEPAQALWILMGLVQNSATWNQIYPPSDSVGVDRLGTDTGNSDPLAGTITIAGGANINSDNNTANVVTVNLNTSIAQPSASADGTAGMYQINAQNFMHSFSTDGTNTFLGENAGNLTLTTSVNNVGVGALALTGLTTGNSNTIVGAGSGDSITTGSTNTVAGSGSMINMLTGSSNVVIGDVSANGLTDETNNTIIGSTAAATMTGSNNVIIGKSAGSAYTNAADTDNNILIKNVGVDQEDNTIHIGTQGSHLATYLAGVSGGTSTGSSVVFAGSNGSLGTLPTAAGAAGTVLTSTGATTAPIWMANGGSSAGSDAFFYYQQAFVAHDLTTTYILGTTSPMLKLYDRAASDQFSGTDFTVNKTGVWFFSLTIGLYNPTQPNTNASLYIFPNGISLPPRYATSLYVPTGAMLGNATGTVIANIFLNSGDVVTFAASTISSTSGGGGINGSGGGGSYLTWISGYYLSA